MTGAAVDEVLFYAVDDAAGTTSLTTFIDGAPDVPVLPSPSKVHVPVLDYLAP